MTQLTPIEWALLKTFLMRAEDTRISFEAITNYFAATSLAQIQSAIAKIDAAVRTELAAESE